MKKWKSLIVLVLIFGLVLAGCAGRQQKSEDQEQEGAEPPAEVSEKDKFGGTFKGRLASDPPTLDPAYITDTTSGQVAEHIFDGLVQYNEEMEIVGNLAKDWKVSEDGLVWTFNLHDNIKFHNGREMTADDFVYSFTRIVDPETASPRAWIFDQVKGVKEFRDGKADTVEGFKAVDTTTFQITLSEAFTPFMIMLTMNNAYVVPKEEVERYGEDFTTHPVGTGAFQFVEWMHDDHVTLDVNEDYFAGRPYLDKVNFRIIPDDSAAFSEYEQGNIHDLAAIPEGQLERVLNTDEFKDELIRKGRLGLYYVGMNTQKEPFTDKKVRQAINHAINKQMIADVLKHGTVTAAKGILPPGIPDYNQEEITGLEYDLDKAKALMSDAGYSDGYPNEIELAYNTDKGHQMIAEAVQADLKKIGINVKLVNMDWGVYITKVDNGDTQMYRMGWIGDPDPDSFLYVLLNSANFGPGGNASFFSNAEFDRLTNEARTLPNGPERMEKYQKAEQIALDEAPWVPLYYYNNLILRKPYVKGYRVNASGVMSYTNVWLSEKD